MSDAIEQYKSRLRKAMARMTALRDALAAERLRHRAPIAVLGIGCRLPPDIDDPERFFDALLAGHDGVGPPPTDRWPASAAVPEGGYLRDIRGFDAGFFGISPREAAAMDPQQRLLLEVTWEALERAGLPPASLPSARVGVWLGIGASGYLAQALDGAPDIYAITGNGGAFASGRLAYTLGLRGPAVALDTACSSSLVAVHLAVQSLRRGETDVAVVGGVNLIVESAGTRLLLESGALSPSGRCRPFDAGADGFTRGEGAVAIVLRRLDDAQADGDPVLAVIRGSAVNQDGRSTGLTAPNVNAQRAMLAAALEDAGVAPASIGYVEAHGTGTALGDPIEFDALTATLGVDGAGPCALGAVKANVGHLEAAAGLVGLIKAIGALRRGVVPPNPTFATPNPHVRLAGSRFIVPTEPLPFPAAEGPRRAGVSAFGMSGTNAHVVLEEAPPAEAAPPGPSSEGTLLMLSARDPAALSALADATADALDGGAPLPDLARTLARRRSAHPHRLAVAVAPGATARPILRAFAAGEETPAFVGDGVDRGAPVFVCAGQGALWPGIGRCLRRLPRAWAVIERAAPIVARHAEIDLVGLLCGSDAQALHETANAQPATVAVTLAVAAWLSDHGVAPAAVVGHSVGEISAACIAGALAFEDALRLACVRGRAMAEARPGGLLAVALDPEPTRQAIHAAGLSLEIAAYNGPRATVVGGAPDALDALSARLAAEGVRRRRLPVPHAFHTAHMEPTIGRFARALGALPTTPLQRPLYSTVTGGAVEAAALTSAHWQAGIRTPVRFGDAIAALLDAGHRLFVEVGPHPALGSLVAAASAEALSLGTLRRDAGPLDALGALGALWTARIPVEPAALFPEPGPVAPAPTYPWQRRPHWIDAQAACAPALAPKSAPPPPETPPADEATARQRVRAAVGAVLGLAADASLPERRGLFELGLDSIMAVELARRLSRTMGRPVGPTTIFEHPTVAALVAHFSRAATEDTGPTTARASGGPIAVVGMACRLPGGANDPETLWAQLEAGRVAIGPVPPDRWDAAAYHDPDPTAVGTMYATHSGFMAGVDIKAFDAAAFGIAPGEARALDPQQRLLLELAWEALERAGHPPDRLEGTRTGVYVGIATSDYGQHVARRPLAEYEPAFATGCAANTAAGRIAYTFGTRGPALAIDTACSSSLVGLHLAIEALRRGEIDRAIVAGTNLILDPTIGVLYSRMSALAPDSACKAFDAAADGLVRGEGVALVVLTRLEDARRAGDRVEALLLGSAINHDGRSSGLTVPNGAAQAAVVRAALRDAHVAPADVEYVEAHGTGTSLGDPIEANALVAALGPGRTAEQPLVLGSVKANLGHLEAAAGMAGLLKVIGALQRRSVPPQPTFRRLNPAIEPGDVELVVPTAPRPITGKVAGLSSFGVSGTNAHVIIAAADGPSAAGEESNAAPEGATGPNAAAEPSSPPAERVFLLPISARDAERRRALAQAWRARLTDVGTPLAILCAGAALRRAHLDHRLAVFADERDGLLDALDRFIAGEADDAAGVAVGETGGAAPRLAWVFSGQGGFWVGMGRGLYRHDATFTRAFAAADAACARQGGPSLEAALMAADATERYADKRILHPLMLGLQVGLAAALRHRGVVPAAVVGHSSGELAAAVVAGALGLDDAFRICLARSSAIGQIQGRGAMAVIGLDPSAAERLIVRVGAALDVAVHNAPGEVILSGDAAAIDALAERCDAENVFFRRVKGADGAGHSRHLDPLLGGLRAAVADVVPRPARLPFFSTVYAERLEGARLDADYWAANLRRPVRFAETVSALLEAGIDGFVEVGPHPVLLRALARIAPDALRVGTLRRDGDDRRALTRTIATLYVRGADPDWAALHPAGSPAVDLPRQPWRRETFWIPAGRAADDGHPVMRRAVEIARTGERIVEFELDPARRDAPPHTQMQGSAVLDPGLLLECVALAWAGAPAAVTLDASCALDGRVEIQVATTVDGAATVHARGDGGPWSAWGSARPVDPGAPEGPSLDAARASCDAADPDFVERRAQRGLTPSTAMDVVEQIWRGPDAVLARLGRARAAWTRAAATSSGLWLLVTAAFGADPSPVPGEIFWPTAVEQARWAEGPITWIHAALRAPVHPVLGGAGDVWFYDAAGRPRGGLQGVRLRPPDRALSRVAAAEALPRWTYASRWIEVPAPEPTLAPGVWLILGPTEPAAALADRLRAAGHRPVESRLERLRDDAARAGDELHGVVDLRPLAGRDPIAAATDAQDGCRRFVEAGVERVWLVTRRAQPIHGGGDPVGGVWWGVLRALALEHPTVRVGLLDVDVDADDPAEIIAAEITGPDREDLVAHRGGDRFGMRLVADPLDLPARPRSFDPDGTYLVTGGLGGIGLHLADWLVDRGARHLVLTSRRGEDGVDADAREFLTALRRRGATVHAPAVDVTDEPAMAALLDAIPATRPLRGVFHAAGATHFGPLVEGDRAAAERVLGAKVAGALILDRLTAGRPLDCFVCFSSAAATWGAAGLALYAAANHALDLLAHRRRAAGLPGTSVAWGGWSGGGMTDAATRAGAAEVGLRSSPARHLLEALDAVLASEAAQRTVADVDWRRFKPLLEARGPRPLLDRIEVAEAIAGQGPLARRLDALAEGDRWPALLAAVAAHAARALGVEAGGALDPTAGFFRLGMDSVMTVNLRQALEVDLGDSLPATVVLDHPNVRELAGWLGRERLGIALDGAAPAPPTATAAPDDADVEDLSASDLDDLSESDLEALLLAELGDDDG